MRKVISFKTACRLSKQLQSQGKKVLFTSGCFDILHIGHVRFLEKAKKWGGRNSLLFVGVDSDKYLTINKGPDRPIYPQNVRAEILSNLSTVDYAVLLKDIGKAGTISDTFIKRYKELSPNIVVFGNTEKFILDGIKQVARLAGCEFRHLPHRTRVESSSQIAKLILDHLPP